MTSNTQTRELDVFRDRELDEVQQHNLNNLRRRFRKFPRAIWIDGEPALCLKVAIGNGHYVAFCREGGLEHWRSIAHDTVSVRFSAPKPKRGI